MKWFSFIVPFPPSANRYYRFPRALGHPLISSAGRDYRTKVSIAWKSCDAFRVVTGGRLIVLLELFPPDKRRRDIDNVQKPLLDALTAAEVWSDDSQIDELTTTRRTAGNVKLRGCVRVHVGELTDEKSAECRTGNPAYDAEGCGRDNGHKPGPSAEDRAVRVSKDPRELGENDFGQPPTPRRLRRTR